MIRRRSVISFCALCVLALSAVVASSANAASNGTTLFTCKGVTPGTGTFKGEHCRPSDAGVGNWSHVAIGEKTTTEITGTSTETTEECKGSKLHSVVAGVEVQLSSPCSHILGENAGEKSWVTNAVDATTGEHYFHGTAWLDYTNVSVTKPAGKGCEVENSTIIAHLKFTTLGQGDNIKFEPATGGKFAEFTVKGCTIAALNGVYEVTGSILVGPDGATLTTTGAGTTAQGTLKLRGQKAGLEGTMTVRGRHPGLDPVNVDTPLSPTTVSTP